MNKILFLDFDGVLNNRKTMDARLICDFHSAIYAGKSFEKEGFNFADECL